MKKYSRKHKHNKRKRKGGASAYQKGLSASMRTYFKDSSDAFNAFSAITHSGDIYPYFYGDNIFADPTNSYDPNAQSIIDHYWNDYIHRWTNKNGNKKVPNADFTTHPHRNEPENLQKAQIAQIQVQAQPNPRHWVDVLNQNYTNNPSYLNPSTRNKFTPHPIYPVTQNYLNDPNVRKTKEFGIQSDEPKEDYDKFYDDLYQKTVTNKSDKIDNFFDKLYNKSIGNDVSDSESEIERDQPITNNFDKNVDKTIEEQPMNKNTMFSTMKQKTKKKINRGGRKKRIKSHKYKQK